MRKKLPNMLIPIYMKSNIPLKEVSEITGIPKKKLAGDDFMEDQEFVMCIVKRGIVPHEKRLQVSKTTVFYKTSHLQKLESDKSYWIKTEEIPRVDPIKMERKKKIPIWEKNLLTIEEASAYFHIAESDVRLSTKQKGCDFCIWIGQTPYIKRQKMEEFMEKTKVLNSGRCEK